MAVKKKRRTKPAFKLLLVAFLLIIMGCSLLFIISPVDSDDKSVVDVEIKSGVGIKGIASILKEKDLIHSKYMFVLYTKFYKINNLKAAKYQLSRDMSLSDIIKRLQEGSNYNPDLVKITFKEGTRITSYAKAIANNTNNSYEEVINKFKDREYAKTLIPKYWFLTEQILNEDIYYPLEGYLAPDTYHFENKDVEVDDIISTLLSESERKLEPYKDKMISNPHNYITMASIVELEGTNTENRKMIVGVFNNRLNSKMNLGSDVTTYYGLQADMKNDLESKDFSSENGYNTRSNKMIGKMPVGPICSPSLSSIEASINPTDNDYLFFVADKYGNIYYTKTISEHEAKVKEIKAKGDWIFN